MLFDGDGNRMTPSHAVKKGTRYRYYVSRSLITKDRTDNSAGLRIPAAQIEQLVSVRVHGWLLDPGSICKSISARLPDASIRSIRVIRTARLRATGNSGHACRDPRPARQAAAEIVRQVSRQTDPSRRSPF